MSDRSNESNRTMNPDRDELFEFLAQVPAETMAKACWWMHERHPGEGHDTIARQFEQLAEGDR